MQLPLCSLNSNQDLILGATSLSCDKAKVSGLVLPQHKVTVRDAETL